MSPFIVLNDLMTYLFDLPNFYCLHLIQLKHVKELDTYEHMPHSMPES